MVLWLRQSVIKNGGSFVVQTGDLLQSLPHVTTPRLRRLRLDMVFLLYSSVNDGSSSLSLTLRHRLPCS
ncbi:terminase RNaseH-like domain containing protein [Alcaligenes phage vB_Af_QDWS535]|nr:terminase RNaseH-like domain containing protein [Alcaligenes phage vB_Af_QDWS535]